MTPTHQMAVPLHTVPVRRATGGLVLIQARWPVGEPPILLGPSSDKPGVLKMVEASRTENGKVVLTLSGGWVLPPLDPDTEVLWALPRDLEVTPSLTRVL